MNTDQKISTTMYFPFDTDKFIESAVAFLRMGGGKMEILKLVKLLYLAERFSLEKRGAPLYGGQYFSLPHGPITSEGLDVLDRDYGPIAREKWDLVAKAREENWLTLKDSVEEPDYLSGRDIKIIEAVFSEHGHRSASAIRNWCHKNIPEYQELEKGRMPITLNEISLALKVDSAYLEGEAAAQNSLLHVFSS